MTSSHRCFFSIVFSSCPSKPSPCDLQLHPPCPSASRRLRPRRSSTNPSLIAAAAKVKRENHPTSHTRLQSTNSENTAEKYPRHLLMISPTCVVNQLRGIFFVLLLLQFITMGYTISNTSKNLTFNNVMKKDVEKNQPYDLLHYQLKSIIFNSLQRKQFNTSKEFDEPNSNTSRSNKVECSTNKGNKIVTKHLNKYNESISVILRKKRDELLKIQGNFESRIVSSNISSKFDNGSSKTENIFSNSTSNIESNNPPIGKNMLNDRSIRTLSKRPTERRLKASRGDESGGTSTPQRRSRNDSGWRPLNKDLHESNFSSGRHNISLLGLFELSTRTGVTRPEGRSELAAAQLAVRHVNARRLLPGYTLQLLTNDTKCDPGVGVDRFFHALYTRKTTRMVMLLGSACSEVTESLAKVVPYWNIVQVSFGSTSPALSDRNEFPLFYRTVAPDSSHNPARIAFIRKFGWDTVTALSQNEEVYSLAVNGLLAELESANITCAASISFAETDFREQLKLLKDLDTRIIVGSFSPEMTPRIFCEAYNLGMYGPDYAWIIQATSLPTQWRNSTDCQSSHLDAAVERLILVSSHNSIVEDEVPSMSGLTNRMFTLAMESAGASVSAYSPQTYDAVWAIALALRGAEDAWRLRQQNMTAATLQRDNLTAQFIPRRIKFTLGHFDYTRKDMAEMFLQQLAQLNFLGVSGPVSFSGADRIGTSAFYQIQDGTLVTVALYHPRTGELDAGCALCRAARWSESGQAPVARRTLRRSVRRVAQPARAAVAALAGAGVALAFAALVLNTHYSKLKSIKLSSPRLNNMTIVGCIFVYIAVVLLGLDHATLPNFIHFSAICTARVYLFSAGFSLAFGSMFAKTYRVHRIFISNRSGVCKTKLLQDTQLISLVCALLLIDGLIVTLWVSIDPMQRYLKNLTIEISAVDRSVVYQPQVEVCRSQNTNGWLGALYAYKGLLLIVGVYMAWETRNVKISALNDSQYIGISVYSVVITSAIVVVLANLISDRATLAYVTITGLILISTTATLCLLFLPKLLSIMHKSDTSDPIVESMGLRIECNTRRFVTDDTQELHYRVEIQNKVYKREMAALDREINRLEKLLDSSTSSTSSSTSLAQLKKVELKPIQENGGSRKHSRDDRIRTPSIGGGLPLLLLSVLPPVIPRASWPSAESNHATMRRSVTFSSQPKLDDNKSQPSIDLYNLCLNKRQDENTGLLSRLKNIFGSKPSSRKASSASIAGPSGPGIATALKLHMGILAGLVPGSKHQMVLSCNTLDVHHSQNHLRRESFSCSGPVINIVSDENFDEPNTSKFPFTDVFKLKKKDIQKIFSEPETKVNFHLPYNQRRPSITHQFSQPVISFRDRAKGSPRFPHKIVPTASSMSQLEDFRRTSSTTISHISNNSLCGDNVRRSSHQHQVKKEKHISKPGPSGTMGGRWKSMEDATLTLPGSRRGSGLLALSYIPSNIYQPRIPWSSNPSQHEDVWATAEKGIPLSEMDAEVEGRHTKYVRKQTSQSSLS